MWYTLILAEHIGKKPGQNTPREIVIFLYIMQDMSVDMLQFQCFLWKICKEGLGTALFVLCHFLFQIIVF